MLKRIKRFLAAMFARGPGVNALHRKPKAQPFDLCMKSRTKPMATRRDIPVSQINPAVANRVAMTQQMVKETSLLSAARDVNEQDWQDLLRKYGIPDASVFNAAHGSGDSGHRAHYSHSHSSHDSGSSDHSTSSSSPSGE